MVSVKFCFSLLIFLCSWVVFASNRNMGTLCNSMEFSRRYLKKEPGSKGTNWWVKRVVCIRGNDSRSEVANKLEHVLRKNAKLNWCFTQYCMNKRQNDGSTMFRVTESPVPLGFFKIVIRRIIKR